MFGLFVLVAGIVAVVRIANSEGRSPWVWGITAFILSSLFSLIPYVYNALSIFMAIIVIMILMMILKWREQHRQD